MFKKINLIPGLSLTLLLFFSACQKEAPLTIDNESDEVHYALAGVSTKSANKFTNLFNRFGNGWTGGDATYSIALPDGRTVWMFGDSFLDTVYADYSRPSSGLIRNCFMVQTGGAMTTLCGNTIDAPQALVDTDDPADEWYWPGDATVIGENLYVFFMYFIRTGPDAFDFAYLRTDLVTFSLPTITETSRNTVYTNNDILWGASLMEDGDYIYVYGAEQAFLTKYAHVSRYPADDITAAPEFWNGASWVSTEPATNVGRLEKQSGLPVEASAQFAVFYSGGKYRLVTQEDLFSPNIYTWEALSPTGPWKKRQTVYVTPETGGDLWTYNAFVHPQFTTADGYMLLSYNENSMNFFDLFEDARIYRPKFIYFKYL